MLLFLSVNRHQLYADIFVICFNYEHLKYNLGMKDLILEMRT